MKKFKEMRFGLLVLMGFLLAGCNTQQDVVNNRSDTKENVHSSGYLPTEKSPTNGMSSLKKFE